MRKNGVVIADTGMRGTEYWDEIYGGALVHAGLGVGTDAIYNVSFLPSDVIRIDAYQPLSGAQFRVINSVVGEGMKINIGGEPAGAGQTNVPLTGGRNFDGDGHEIFPASVIAVNRNLSTMNGEFGWFLSNQAGGSFVNLPPTGY